MPQQTSGIEVWESRRVRALRFAHKRLLVSVPLFIVSVGVRQGVHVSSKLALWTTWFVSMTLALLVCALAAETVHKMKAIEKENNVSFAAATARAVLWLSVLWIIYLALDVCMRIAPVSG